MDLRPGVPLTLLGSKLDEIRRGLADVRGGGSHYDAYVKWADNAVTHLSPLISPEDLDRAVTSRRHRQLRTWDTSTTTQASLFSLVRVEVDERLAVLDELLGTFQRETKRWESGHALMLADTNIYMHHRLPFYEINWHELLPPDQQWRAVDLLVPLLVVEELDTGRTRAKSKAAQAAAKDALKRLVGYFQQADSAQVKTDEVATTTDTQQFPVHARLVLPDPTRPRLPIADDELTYRVARGVQDWADRPVYFVTLDEPSLLRARNAGLRAIFRPEDRRPDSPPS